MPRFPGCTVCYQISSTPLRTGICENCLIPNCKPFSATTYSKSVEFDNDGNLVEEIDLTIEQCVTMAGIKINKLFEAMIDFQFENDRLKKELEETQSKLKDAVRTLEHLNVYKPK